jgi:transcriptional regulator with XRE-family HTH domain
MPRHPFSTLLERKYLEWQIEIGERKSQAEFAKLIGVSRAALTMWMNGDHLPEMDNIHKLANVLGNEVYDALDLPRPNPYLQKINQLFERLSSEQQRKIADDVERYQSNNHEENAKRSSKERKTSPR